MTTPTYHPAAAGTLCTVTGCAAPAAVEYEGMVTGRLLRECVGHAGAAAVSAATAPAAPAYRRGHLVAPTGEKGYTARSVPYVVAYPCSDGKVRAGSTAVNRPASGPAQLPLFAAEAVA